MFGTERNGRRGHPTTSTDLKRAGYQPDGDQHEPGRIGTLEQVEKDALDYAIANGVIVVAAAGNEGEAGMSFPGAYAPVISAGAIGWIGGVAEA